MDGENPISRSEDMLILLIPGQKQSEQLAFFPRFEQIITSMQTCQNRFLMESSKFPRDNRVLYDRLVSFLSLTTILIRNVGFFHQNGRVLLTFLDLFNKTKQNEDDLF